jgi:hypothetical protein
MTTRRQRRTKAEWSALIERWRQSGLTAEVFADERGLSRTSLYVWSKRLVTDAERGGLGLAQAVAKPSSAFAEIRLTSAAQPSGRIEVVARSGRVVRVEGEVSVDALRSVLTAGEQC